jgi:hypothetical protein
VKKILGDMRSVTSDPVVRYAEKRASTNNVVNTGEDRATISEVVSRGGVVMAQASMMSRWREETG